MRWFLDFLWEDQWVALWSWIPQRLRDKKPERLFRSSIDGADFLLNRFTNAGFNLTRLLQKTENKNPVILLIKTNYQCIIGAFISCNLEKSQQFRGSGEMFVFQLAPKMRRYSWTGENSQFLRVGNNACIQFIHSQIDDRTLMIGGGFGTALWIDDGESCSEILVILHYQISIEAWASLALPLEMSPWTGRKISVVWKWKYSGSPNDRNKQLTQRCILYHAESRNELGLSAWIGRK